LGNNSHGILKALAYFDIFHYPLTAEEIQALADCDATTADAELQSLIEAGIVFAFDGFYALQDNPPMAAARRKANTLAAIRMKDAVRSAAIIARFPYVAAVAVSGSLSKNFADEKTDIDFFIIAAPGRLWVARTFLHLLKKLSFVTGSQHLFCMNYFVDTDALEIAEQNIFTAVEVITLLPMHGPEVLQRFADANQWTVRFFPQPPMDTAMARPVKKGWLARMIQKLLDGGSGNRLDQWLMKVTDRRWQQKARRNQLNSRGIKMSMVASRHCSKPNPANFQQKVVRQYEEKMTLYEMRMTKYE
jgi:predicted nucleotidyltransferase